MPSTILNAINAKKSGYHIGQRLILPFRCQMVKMMVEGEIITEFVGSKHIKLSQDPKNTSIYFRSSGNLDNFVDSYKVVKLIVSEWDADLTDMANHIKLICRIEENHEVLWSAIQTYIDQGELDLSQPSISIFIKCL